MIALDTSIVVDYLRNRTDAVDLLEQLVIAGERLIASEIVRFEVLVGVRQKERRQVEQFFTVLDWIPVDEQVARLGADLARQFRASHSGIDSVDFLIAATALRMNATLLTTNIRHFPMFQDLAAPY